MATSVDGQLGLSRGQRMTKRALDLVASASGLVLLAPIILVAWVVASLDARANGFFRQERVGRNGECFTAVKIRTMRASAEGSTVTVKGDPRITRSGRFFRRLKIDEMPQLWNVLTGKMSMVGPRPDVPGFADTLTGDHRIILTVRPGITGPATLKYRDEEAILQAVSDPEDYNARVIFPDKVQINVNYVQDYSLWTDMKILWQTLFS